MATNKVYSGEVLNHVAGSDLSSGDVVLFGAVNSVEARIGIVLADIANGATGALAIKGVWRLPKKASDGGITQGAVVFLDSGDVTDTVTDNHRCGRAASTQVEADTTVDVLIDW